MMEKARTSFRLVPLTGWETTINDFVRSTGVIKEEVILTTILTQQSFFCESLGEI